MEYSLGRFAVPETGVAEDRVDVWFRAGLVRAFSVGRGTRVRFGGRRVAVYRDDGPGNWFAFEDRCPRCGEAVLAEGTVEITGAGPTITCPSGDVTFHIGEGTGEPSVRSIPVVVEDEHVFIGFRHGVSRPST